MQVIDRDTLTNKAEILYQHTSSGKIIPWSAVRVCVINNIKTVDAEPVRHGRWETYPSHAYRRCSVCKTEWDKPKFNIHANYCPNCGAKMD